MPVKILVVPLFFTFFHIHPSGLPFFLSPPESMNTFRSTYQDLDVACLKLNVHWEEIVIIKNFKWQNNCSNVFHICASIKCISHTTGIVPYPGLFSFTKLKLVWCLYCFLSMHNTQYTSNQMQFSNQRRIIQGWFTFQIETIWSRNNYVYPLILDNLFNYPSISIRFPTQVDFTCLQFRAI